MFIPGLEMQDRLPREPDVALLSNAVVAGGFALEAPRQLQHARAPRRIFISGHSLIDRPFPEQLAQIGAQLGKPLYWERHYLPGSSIRDRAHLPMPNGSFDTALLTEQHDVLSSLAWHDTPRQLRGWQDRLIAGSPDAATFFYVPWLAMDDRNDPSRWIAYERAAFHVWQCINTRINQDLARDGRTDRIATIPANLALAYLVGQMQQGSRIPGMEAAGLRVSVDALFTDSVHLTPLGNYYVAVVSYMGISGMKPAQAETGQERFLADAAIRFFNSRVHEARAMKVADCRRYVGNSFLDDYLSYSRRPWWKAMRMRMAIASSPLFK